MLFRPLELTDKDTLNTILLPLARNDSALGFANLFSLTEKYGTEFCIQDETLFIRQTNRINNAIAYYPPLGTHNMAHAVALIQTQADAEQTHWAFVGCSDKDCTAISCAIPGAFEFSSDRNFADYIYLTDVLAHYSGPALAKKRRETNKFFKLYGETISFESIKQMHIEELRQYQNRWFESSKLHGENEHNPEFEHRKIMLDLDHFYELDLQGILVRINGRIEGYAYGCVLPGKAFDVMVLKGNLEFRYIWRAILRELALYCSDISEYMNLEEDLGLPGLRENKLSYQPYTLMEKFQSQIKEF